MRKSRNRDRDMRTLVNKSSNLQTQDSTDVQAINEIKQNISELEMEKIEGVKIRSRAAWSEHGEKPTKFFFNLEKRKQERACITKFHTDTGQVTTDEDILHKERRFYQDLYRYENGDNDMQSELLEQLEKHLPEERKNLCEGPIMTAGLSAVRRKINMNKSPGPDSLTTEFYNTFWTELEAGLVELYNSNFLMGEMTQSQQETILRLLYKKQERELLKNWRPISLLNTDYKILATALANRLRVTLPDIIHKDQTCRIPGQTIFDTVLRLRDMAREAKIKQQNLIIISLDQEKDLTE